MTVGGRNWRDMSTTQEMPGFSGGSVVKNLPANAGDVSLIPDPGDPTCHRSTKHHDY